MRTCVTDGCEKSLGDRNTTGFCRSCYVRLPEVQAKRIAAYRRYAATGAAQKSIAHATSVWSQQRLGWCPDKFRKDYFRLLSLKIKASEARKVIQAQIAHERRNESFEQKLARVHAGEATVAPALIRHHLTPTVRA